MKIHCVWEHNGNDTLLYAIDFVGAYARGKNLEEAVQKMPQEIASYCKWCGENFGDSIEVVIVQEKNHPSLFAMLTLMFFLKTKRHR